MNHVVGKQNLTLVVSDEASAMALHSRIADINKRLLLPVIQKVLDELATPNEQVCIDKLSIDLGTLPLTGFEQYLGETFESLFREALLHKLHGKVNNPKVVVESKQQSQLRLLQHYLQQGALPWYAHKRQQFDFESQFMALAESSQSQVLTLLSRLAGSRYAIERLVVQLQETSLLRLMQWLEPRHGSLIIAYILDLVSIHVQHRQLPIGTARYRRLLWVLALSYTIDERGSQFNRRSFVKSLLLGMSRSEGVDYGQLLESLNAGLVRIAEAQPLQSSLPAVIAGLVSEQQQKNPRRIAQNTPEDNELVQDSILEALARLEYYLQSGLMAAQQYSASNRGSTEFAALLSELGGKAPAETLNMLRRLARQTKPGLSLLIERLLRAFTPASLVNLLAGDNQQLIERWVSLLMAVAMKPPKPLPQASDRIVWHAVLEYLTLAAGSPLQAQRLVGQTLAVISRHKDVPVENLAQQLQTLLAGHSSGKVKSLLQEALEELVAPEAAEFTPYETEEPLFQRYDQLDILQHWFSHGDLPWRLLWQSPSRSLTDFLSAMFTIPGNQLQALLATTAQEKRPALYYLLLQQLPPEQWQLLLSKLLPGQADSPLAQAIVQFMDSAAHPTCFAARLLTAIVSRQELDLDAMALAGELDAPLSTDVGQWHSQQVLALLTRRIHNQQYGESLKPGTIELLQRLVSGYPNQVRPFISTLFENADVSSQLLSHTPDHLVGHILDVLQPEESPTLKALMAALDTVAAPWRPAAGHIRRVLVAEALYLERPLGSGFFSRILRQLFQGTLSAPLKSHLLDAAQLWANSGILPQNHIDGFIMAVKDNTRQSEPAPGESLTEQTTGDNLGTASPAEHEVYAFLLNQSVHGSNVDNERYIEALTALFEGTPENLRRFVQQYIGDSATREHWVNVLPVALLVRFVWLLQPQQTRVLLASGDTIVAGWLELTPTSSAGFVTGAAYWRFMLDFVAQHNGANCTLDTLTFALFEHLAYQQVATVGRKEDAVSQNEKAMNARAQLGQRFHQAVVQLARRAGQNALLAVLHKDKQRLLSPWVSLHYPAEVKNPPGQTQTGGEKSAPPKRQEKPMVTKTGTPVYVDNAGLVLVAVYLPHLFQQLDMLVSTDQGKRLRDADTVTRAVHLLQFLVDGRCDTPEAKLALNKAMCGVPLATVVDNSINMTEAETALCEQLLNAVLSNWTSLSGTSIAGLRETFLQREGKLLKTDSGWQLTVQRKTLDVLVDQVPWRIGLVSESWMTETLHVHW